LQLRPCLGITAAPNPPTHTRRLGACPTCQRLQLRYPSSRGVTSFACEKHLALRNTPYSSVKHSRVIRAGGDSSPHRSPPYEHDTPLGLSRITNDRDVDLENTDPSMPYPTPKALFRDRPGGYSSPDSTSKPLPFPYTRTPSPSPQISQRHRIRQHTQFLSWFSGCLNRVEIKQSFLPQRFD